jgi:hypothetical protein
VDTTQARNPRFETHVSKHQKAHLNIKKATGTAMAENTKIGKLLTSLCCAKTNVPISTIRAQENLCTSFDELIKFLQIFILGKSHGDERNVASFDAEQTNKRKDNPNYKKCQGNFKKKKDSGSSSTSAGLDQFYRPAEWWKLDQKIRDMILALRKDATREKVQVCNVTRQERHHSD